MLKKIAILLIVLIWPINYIRSGNTPQLQKPETILTNDYEAEQLVLRNIQLYPTVFTARLFQNKPRIYLNKFTGNFFSLTDPNYYFFGLHPRPIVPDNKNLFKFPFPAIIFFLVGAFSLSWKKNKVFLLYISTTLLFLSILKNFDGFDIILFPGIVFLIIKGMSIMEEKNKKLFLIILALTIIFGIPEIIRSFI
jgi:hypothetical protein